MMGDFFCIWLISLNLYVMLGEGYEPRVNALPFETKTD